MSVRIDKSQFDKLIRDLPEEVDRAWLDSGDYFRSITPKRTGNARSKTIRDSQRILAQYPYAGDLDQGSSRQAPDGMSDPTIEYFEKQIDKIVRKSNGS